MFSLESAIRAFGVGQDPVIVASAVIIAVLLKVFSAGTISDFVRRNPMLKVLALVSRLLIGGTLFAVGFDRPIARGYVYFAMAFSAFVEMLNILLRKAVALPVEVRTA